MERFEPTATPPTCKKLKTLCPVKDKQNYFKKIYAIRPRLYWTADLMLVLRGNALRATNIVNLVAALYRPPAHRLRGDVEFATELHNLHLLPKAMAKKAGERGSSISRLLYPYYWINTTVKYEQHWAHFINDDDSGIEHYEPYS
jgi:hypothetical protein